MSHSHEDRAHAPGGKGHRADSHSKAERTPGKHGDHADHSDHRDHHAGMIRDFRLRFFVSLALTVPVLLLSPMIQGWLAFEWGFTGDKYLLFALSSAIYFYGGYPFLKGLYDELKDRAPAMMTLIAVAITAAYLYSSAVVFGFEGKTFFWELATLIDVMLVGHWIEMRSVMGASKALEALAALMPDIAHVRRNNEWVDVKLDDLKAGDVILVKPGEKVPVDGEIVEGSSELDESLLTGESVPVSRSAGDKTIGGAINGNGAIQVELKTDPNDNYLSRVVEIVKAARKQKSRTQRLADKAAFWLTIVALAGGFGTFALWLSLGEDLAFAMERMVTVMVISCPHALGLAIPLVTAISTSHSAKNGLLIRNRTAFENARKISTVVFDKTGTLTKGSHELQDIVPLTDEYYETELLRYAASVESPSEHHIGKGLLRKAKSANIELFSLENFEYESGIGVQGLVNGKDVRVGGPAIFTRLNIDMPDIQVEDALTAVFVLIEGKPVGYITFADEIRESAFEAIQILRENQIKLSLLTGDTEAMAAAVADKLGFDVYKAGVLPEEKLDFIKKLQSDGEFVAMTGDGVNDAPALAQADVGIAIGSGTDVAAETADIVLVDSDPRDVARLIVFGKASYRKMVQNLVWATGYNAIAMPLATGFVPGLMISPAAGAALMSLSTIICALNAQLLSLNLK